MYRGPFDVSRRDIRQRKSLFRLTVAYGSIWIDTSSQHYSVSTDNPLPTEGRWGSLMVQVFARHAEDLGSIPYMGTTAETKLNGSLHPWLIKQSLLSLNNTYDRLSYYLSFS